MHPLVPILACYGMGLALLFARGGGRDPLLSGALAMPVGAAATALLVFAFDLAGAPLGPAAFAAAWGALVALAVFAARRQLGRLWPAPAAIAAAIALLAVIAARIDLTVLELPSHDALLSARILAGGHQPVAGASRLASSLHAAFFLVSSDHVPALVSVLAACALFAAGVLIARAADHPRRAWLGALAALALASWFPLLRSLVTVASPGAAGTYLLAAGGLWLTSERARDARPLPLALVALAAFALQGARFAAGAALFLLFMAAGTRLSRRGLGWRHRLMALHPGLRLAAAAALSGVPRGFVGPTGPLLAVAPCLLLALVAWAASEDDHDLVPGESPVTRADLARLPVAWVAGAALLAFLEHALLNLQAGDRFAGSGQRLRLLPLGFGNLLPYALLASLLLLLAEVAARELPARRRRLAVAAGAALLAVPYAIWLGRYTFSGPQAQAMAHHHLYVAAAALVVAAGFAAAIWFAVLRRDRPGWRIPVLAALVLGVAAMLVLSRAGLVNEYEPLHQFLAIWALLLAALAGREISDLVPLHARAARALAVGAVAWTLVAGLVLARAHGDAWLVWGETGASRYLTSRWSFLTPTPDLATMGATMIVKPDLESPRAAALRAERAAAPAPNIVLFSVDGLRQDRVGAYGHTGRRLTPTIDRFAARGVRFTRAFSSFPATQVFNSALLLGRFVDRSARVQQPPSYRAHAITNLLKQRDYHIFVKSWFEQSLSNRFDARPYHFDTYVPKAKSPEELEEPMEEGLARLAAHLDQAKEKGRPAFVWMHLLATHPMKGQGFRPDPDFAFGDSQMDRYESAVAGSDRWLAGVEELMTTRLDSGRPTIWVILADHGVNEHTRSRDLFEPIVRVPFIIVAPGLAPRVDDHPVDVSLDLAATVVDWAGIAPPPEYDGISLVPLLAGLPADVLRDRLIPLAYVGDWTGAIHRDSKYLRHKDVMSFFDLAADPHEKVNLIGQEFDRAYAMRQMADRELERRLRAADEARDGP